VIKKATICLELNKVTQTIGGIPIEITTVDMIDEDPSADSVSVDKAPMDEDTIDKV